MLDSLSQQVSLQILDDAASLSPNNGSRLLFFIFRLALRYTGSRIHDTGSLGTESHIAAKGFGDFCPMIFAIPA